MFWGFGGFWGVRNLTMLGQKSGYKVGADLSAGANGEVRKGVMGGIGGFYVAIEGAWEPSNHNSPNNNYY
eukprot:2843685-Amphidinium_carterae.1